MAYRRWPVHSPLAGALAALAIGLVPSAAMLLPSAAGARTETQAAKRVASIATLTTPDYRAALVAERVGAGATPTADVRLAVAQRVGGNWRERGERRLEETYFWKTVTGPRAVCRLELATATTRSGTRPHVTVRLLQSPSLGCGPTHRLSLPSR
jgi:hypothetical protein